MSIVVPDIACLREPNLLTPGKKPVGNVQCDPRSALCLPLQGNRNDLCGNQWSGAFPAGHVWGVNQGSQYVGYDGSFQTESIPFKSAKSGHDATVIGVVSALFAGSTSSYLTTIRYESFTSYSFIDIRLARVSGSGIKLSVYSQTRPADAQEPSVYAPDPGSVPFLSPPYTIVGVCRPTGEREIYTSYGEASVSQAYTFTDRAIEKAYFFYQSRVNVDSLNVHFAAAIPYAVSQAEARALARDPYQILIPA